MVHMTIDLPDGVVSAMRRDPVTLANDMRIAAAVKWYELKMLSQSAAAEVAGLSRAEFLLAAGRLHVTPFQYGAEEILEESSRE